MDVVVNELPLVSGPVSPQELALSILLSFFVLSFVASSIRPDFSSVPVLLVLTPVSLILGAVGVVVSTFSVGLVVLPLSLVDVSVSVDESSSSVGLVVAPVALINGAVNPDLDSSAVLHVSVGIPLSLILGAVGQFDLLLLHSLDSVVLLVAIVEGWKLFSDALSSQHVNVIQISLTNVFHEVS